MSAISLPAPRHAARIRRALTFGAAITALVLLAVFVATNVSASLAQRSLRSQWEAALADPASHVPPRAGDPVARMRVATAGLDAVVVEGTAEGQRGPVHLPATALPGTPGVSAIEAGRLGFGSFFAWIDRVSIGDEIAVQGFRGVVTYQVIDMKTMPRTAVDLSGGGDASILVLIAPASRLGNADRIVIRAKAVP